MSMRSILRLAAAIAVILSIFLMTVGPSQAAVAKGKPAPDFTLKGLDGKTYKLSDYKGKKAVVLDFWAVWCPPCRESLPQVQKLWKKYEQKPVQFLGINVDGEGDVRGTVKQYKLTYPNLIDTKNISGDYGVYLPLLVVIDKQGIVRSILVGYHPDLGRELSRLLDLYSR